MGQTPCDPQQLGKPPMARKRQEFELHPLAESFPAMSELEYEALKEDIRAHGQKEKILLFAGKILDGRHRYRACRELGLQPEFDTFEGTLDEARERGASANLMRRDLSKSQKAMVIVLSGLVPPPAPQGTRRKYGTGRDAIIKVGQRFGVNHMTLYKAAFVAARDEQLAQKVVAGTYSVGAAERILKNGAPAEGELLDANQRPVPSSLEAAFRARATFDAIDAKVRDAMQSLGTLLQNSLFHDENTAETIALFDAARRAARQRKPHSVCGKCAGGGCTLCDKRGWLPDPG